MTKTTTTISEEFAARTGPFRHELLAHCYRMLGSVHDAEDQLQETMLRAWRAYDSYDPDRAALRTWLYRIATNTCLTALTQRSRRPLPSGLGAPGDDPDAPFIRVEEVPWLQPIPDRMVSDPAGILAARHTLRLAFVAALQYLPARQRAVLILRDVLEWPAAEVAPALGMSTPAVNSALRRARARLQEAGICEEQVGEPADRAARELVDRYVAAFEDADLAALERLLTDDVILEMPPYLAWYLGREHYVRFIGRTYTNRGTNWRLLPIRANGQPAVAAYTRAPDGRGYVLNTLQIFTVTPAGISRTTAFHAPEVIATFGLAGRIPMDGRDPFCGQAQG
jgi:RNA polymerase sigma-70 factor (ECF subfamily)